MPQLIIDNIIISTPLLNIIQDIKKQIEYSDKLRIIQKQSSNIRLCCPHHNDGKELHPDCNVYIGEDIYDSTGNLKVPYGTTKCFACNFKTNFIGFVAECFNINYSKAKKWLINNYGEGKIQDQLKLPPIINVKDFFQVKSKEVLDLEKEGGPFIEYKNYPSYCSYMEKRKISKEVAEKFEVKYNPSMNTLVFPVRDEKGRLVMFTQRSCVDKTFIIDACNEKPIYLLYHILQNNINEVFICESQINALTLWNYNLPAVALFGTGSKHQYELLNNSNIRFYNLCFDGDEAGKKAVTNFIRNIRKDVIVNVVNLPEGRDINDLTYEELKDLLKKHLNLSI